jgi:hypothetical protein
MSCEHCKKTLGGAVIHDHGKAYHPDCYALACKRKMTEMVKETVRKGDDWSMGIYET